MIRRGRPVSSLYLASSLLRRHSMMTLSAAVAAAAGSLHAELASSRQAVHERLYKGSATPSSSPNFPLTSDEHLEAAKSALLQLNVMVAQGIEPDVHMYTSLITVMAKARLEWQAFKLFSRMLEQGVKPLPETYVALKRATNPKRVKMIEKIESKMSEANSLLPEQLATAMKLKTEQSERAADRNLRSMKNPQQRGEFGDSKEFLGDDDGNYATFEGEAAESDFVDDETFLKANSRKDKKSKTSSTTDKSKKKSAEEEAKQRRREKVAEVWQRSNDIPVMKIDTIEGVMATIEQLNARDHAKEHVATGEQRVKLSQRLRKLHDEELRILLTIHRHARHGNREQLLHRVLSHVSAPALEVMLQRRAHYFDSVKQVLEAQMAEMKLDRRSKHDARKKESGSNNSSTSSNAESALTAAENTEAPSSHGEAVMSESEGSSSITKRSDRSSSIGLEQRADHQKDGIGATQQGTIQPKDASSLSQHERFMMSPDYLEAPWGLIRKPPAGLPNISEPNPDRDGEQRLTAQELTWMENALVQGKFDSISGNLLRRYGRHFHLKWKRHAPHALDSLRDLVEWHLRTFEVSPGDAGGGGVTDIVPRKRKKTGEAETATTMMQKYFAATDAAEEERRAKQDTLDQYSALIAVAKVTDNMRLVDDAEVSRAVISRRAKERVDLRQQRQLEEAERYARKKRQLDESMRKMPSARSDNVFASSGEDAYQQQTGESLLEEEEVEGRQQQLTDRSHSAKPRSSSVLGVDHQSSMTRAIDQQAEQEMARKSKPRQGVQELPPWEVTASDIPFNLRTGKFDVGVAPTQYTEDSTGRYRVRKSFVLKNKYFVDEDLLPAPQQSRIRQQKLDAETAEEAWNEEQRDHERLRQTSTKYSRFRDFTERAKERQKLEKEASGTVRAYGRPVRMAYAFSRNKQAPPLRK